jgi:hypothetical protein
MIPKFFRCGDPSGKCPYFVSKDILRETPSFQCPCRNETCQADRKEVGLLDGLTNGRSKFVYTGAALVAISLLLVLIMGGGDPAEKALAELRARLAPLESELQQLELKSKGSGSIESQSPDPKPLESAASVLEKQATDAIGSKDPMLVASIQKRITAHLATVRGVIESLDRPKEGSGVIAADAKSLVSKLSRLEDDAEIRLEPVITSSPQSAEVCEDFLTQVSNCQARARRLGSPGAPSGPSPESRAIRQGLILLS